MCKQICKCFCKCGGFDASATWDIKKFYVHILIKHVNYLYLNKEQELLIPQDPGLQEGHQHPEQQ